MNYQMGKISTTLNVKKSIRERFEEAAEQTGLPKSNLFALLIKHCLKSKMKHAVFMKSVKYQKKDPDDSFGRMHVVVQGKDYEYMADIRKMLRVSVSFFFAAAVEECLDELMMILKGKSINEIDNYLTAGYISMCSWSDTAVKWTFYWGIPRRLGKKRNMEDLLR